MTYALATLFVLTLALAGAAAVLADVDRSFRGLSLALKSFF
jgi:hypothetical protein